ncbi:methyl-accepting chemotaxis protein [Stappia sp. ES.058]|uniref:methyl-accepting chemotaxis protein n=1 Tax=Stappia sp. ES.058 TaxID=1881061 RepID=UPI00210F53B1|nr:methyl-accepting chemotaxis protein [Stappia sp. ES.058]
MRNMEAVVGSRKSELALYLKSIEEDLLVVADSAMARDALTAFQTSYGNAGAGENVALRDAYIFDNPNPLGEKHKLDAATDGSAYTETHARFHPWFRNLLQARGYYDIFLVEPNGDLVYSVFKENDFATNLLTGKWQDTDIAKVFKNVRDNAAAGSIAFTDFAAYTPSNGAPASFIATPVIDDAGRFKGALVFQMPIDRINTIMGNAAGLGRTGETYLVGSDMLMRSDSRFRKDGAATSILRLKVDTATVRDALAGKVGVGDAVDYRGEMVLSGYTPLTFNGVTWALLADIDAQEVQEPTVELRNSILLLAAGIVVITGLAGFVFARSVSGPISRMNATMLRLADGDLGTDVPYQGRGDEIGDMASAVQTFKDNALEVKRLESQQAELEARAAEDARVAREKLASEFEAAVGGIVDSVASAATEMLASAQTLSASAEENSASSATVSAAAEEASTNVQAVSGAAEELSSSISEINRQVNDSQEISEAAVQSVAATNQRVSTLTTAADKIGEVIALITDIAEQTNLLALNATIEAARAGEAGKGFAVVAAEVKELASQTAKATEEIGKQIKGIQGATEETVGSIGSIGETIDRIRQVSTAISASVEQQGSATHEIARNIEQVSSGMYEVTTTITSVSSTAAETGAASSQLVSAANELSQQSEVLRSEVDKFLRGVRAA